MNLHKAKERLFGRKLTIVKTKDVQTPKKAHPGDAFDLYIPEDFLTYRLMPGERITVELGIILNTPDGYRAKILPRSGNASRNGIEVHLGTIDTGYRGEINAIIYNFGREPFVLKPGMRIAQMTIEKIEEFELKVVKTVDVTKRGKNGLGSTGL